MKRKGVTVRSTSERSVEQRRGSMNKNRLMRREGSTSGQKTAKCALIKTRQRKVGDRARKEVCLIWGDLRGAAARAAAGRAERPSERPREVSSARSSEEGRETGLSEGANGAAVKGRVNGAGLVSAA